MIPQNPTQELEDLFEELGNHSAEQNPNKMLSPSYFKPPNIPSPDLLKRAIALQDEIISKHRTYQIITYLKKL
jgi:hypothetical protein